MSSMNTIRILVIDPLAQSRDRLTEALSHRFDAIPVEGRLQALEALRKNPSIRLILVSSFQAEWKGKQLARHIRKRVGAACPSIWHYGEVDGCARVSEVIASEYKKKYSIDKFLTATLAPVEIARAVGAHFHHELLEIERQLQEPEEKAGTGDRAGWTDRLGLDLGAVKQALDLVKPIEELPENPRWKDLLRARVNPRTLWLALNKDIVEPVDLSGPAYVGEMLRARVTPRNLGRLLITPIKFSSAA
jgi:hypothetical protein